MGDLASPFKGRSLDTVSCPPGKHETEETMREWLVIENSWKKSVFASDEDQIPIGYIPRDVAEKLLGRDLGGTVWFTKEDSKRMRAHPEWRDTPPPRWTPLGFWSEVGFSLNEREPERQ